MLVDITTIAVSKETKEKLVQLKYARNFKSFDEVVKYLLDIMETKSTYIDVETLIRSYAYETCKSFGYEAKFWLKLLIKRYPNLPREVVEYIEKQNGEIDCSKVLSPQ